MSDHPTDHFNPASGSFDTSEIRAALEAVCDSGDFKRSTRLNDLLRYIVTEEIEGRGDRLKAYSIATKVLGRRADFDPINDSIVRVEMARLRIALKLHYASVESAPLVIEVPKGRYRPVFVRDAATIAERPSTFENDAEAPQLLPISPHMADGGQDAFTHVRVGARPIAAMICLLFALSSALWGYFYVAQPKEPNERLAPLLLVAPVKIASSNGQVDVLAATLRSVLVSEFATDPVVEVAFFNDQPRELASRTHENRALYFVRLSIATASEYWSVSANLQDARTRTVLWSRSENIPANVTQSLTWAYDYSRKLAAIVSDPFSVVARAEMSGKMELRQCLILMRRARSQWTEDALRRFVDCASQMESGPDSESALALALMARGNYMAARWLGSADREQKLELAARQTARALAREPNLYVAEMSALRVAACRNDEEAVQRLVRSVVSRWSKNLEAIPEAAYATAFMLNDIATAERIMAMGGGTPAMMQTTEALPVALKAFQKGDMTEMMAALRRSTNLSHPAANVLALIASVGLRDEGSYRSAMTRFAEGGFRTPESILGIVAGSCWNSQVKADLGMALRAALATSLGRSH